MTRAAPTRRAARPRRRARAPQPRDVAALAGRRARHGARRRRRLEGRAARSLPCSPRSPPRARCPGSSGPTAWRSRTARSSSSTGSLPQSWLGGEATARGELYALRHHLLPARRLCPRPPARPRPRVVAADRPDARRRSASRSPPGASSTSTSSPSSGGATRACRAGSSEQLGIVYRCLSGLPENWILNTDEESPAAPPRVDVPEPARDRVRADVVVLLLVCARPRRWTVAAGVVAYAGLLWTHTRAAFLALAVGLLVARVAAPLVGAGRARRYARSSSRASSSRSSRRSGPRRRTPRPSSRVCARTPPAGHRLDRSVQRRRELDLQPSACAARRDRDRRAAPVGVRARQRGRVGLTDARRRQGGRVELHGARGRRRPCSGSRRSSAGSSRSASHSGTLAVADGVDRRSSRCSGSRPT